jgi:DNA-binding Lrp family transcriptional regulator
MAGVTDQDRALLAALADGLQLEPRHYAAIGRRLGVSEDEVIARLRSLREAKVIRRFGVIVRHHELGYRANAMVVWDVPDGRVDAVGTALAAVPGVTLCYRRPRRLPDWPYNLFCMIHGTDRVAVRAAAARAAEAAGISDRPSAVLFSGRRYRQRGARFAAAAE